MGQFSVSLTGAQTTPPSSIPAPPWPPPPQYMHSHLLPFCLNSPQAPTQSQYPSIPYHNHPMVANPPLQPSFSHNITFLPPSSPYPMSHIPSSRPFHSQPPPHPRPGPLMPSTCPTYYYPPPDFPYCVSGYYFAKGHSFITYIHNSTPIHPQCPRNTLIHKQCPMRRRFRTPSAALRSHTRNHHIWCVIGGWKLANCVRTPKVQKWVKIVRTRTSRFWQNLI